MHNVLDTVILSHCEIVLLHTQTHIHEREKEESSSESRIKSPAIYGLHRHDRGTFALNNTNRVSIRDFRFRMEAATRSHPLCVLSSVGTLLADVNGM